MDLSEYAAQNLRPEELKAAKVGHALQPRRRGVDIKDNHVRRVSIGPDLGLEAFLGIAAKLFRDLATDAGEGRYEVSAFRKPRGTVHLRAEDLTEIADKIEALEVWVGQPPFSLPENRAFQFTDFAITQRELGPLETQIIELENECRGMQELARYWYFSKKQICTRLSERLDLEFGTFEKAWDKADLHEAFRKGGNKAADPDNLQETIRQIRGG